jgi:hypothetical protein
VAKRQKTGVAIVNEIRKTIKVINDSKFFLYINLPSNLVFLNCLTCYLVYPINDNNCLAIYDFNCDIFMNKIPKPGSSIGTVQKSII